MRNAEISINFRKAVINIHKSVVYFGKEPTLGDVFQSLFCRLSF